MSKFIGLFVTTLVVVFANLFCANIVSAQMPIGTAPNILAEWENAMCPNGYYDITHAAVNRNRIRENGECYVEFAFGIPGKMGYRRGFGGNQCLPRREVFIIHKSSVSETGVINRGTRVDIRQCGNGFELGIVLNILNAERVEGEECGMRFWEKKPDPPKAEAAPPLPPSAPVVSESAKADPPAIVNTNTNLVRVAEPITKEELENALKKSAQPPNKERGWWSRNWGWVAGGGIVVAGAVIALSNKKDRERVDNGNPPTISGGAILYGAPPRVAGPSVGIGIRF